MMDEISMAELAKEIMEQGYDEQTAWQYASLIGDLPMVDEQGSIIVLDEERHELARLKPLRMFTRE